MNKEKYWDRVALYGTFDGFTYSTDDLTKMIVILDGGERVEIPDGCVISADQIVEKDKIKLKDVIRRINRLDEDSKTYWLDTILNWFSLDFGLTKYRQGYEQGKLEGEWVGQQLKDADKIRQELNKPVVPQSVADWYEKNKNNLDYNIWNYVYEWEDQEEDELKNWFNHSNKAFQIIANMHQFGYEIEKEKRYLVKVKNIGDGWEYLKWNNVQQYWYFGNKKRLDDVRLYHTLENLQKGGFGNVFVNPLFTIEEVE